MAPPPLEVLEQPASRLLGTLGGHVVRGAAQRAERARMGGYSACVARLRGGPPGARAAAILWRTLAPQAASEPGAGESLLSMHAIIVLKRDTPRSAASPSVTARVDTDNTVERRFAKIFDRFDRRMIARDGSLRPCDATSSLRSCSGPPRACIYHRHRGAHASPIKWPVRNLQRCH